jgi:hypothetical protein
MPDQLVLPRLDAERVTTEQEVAVRRLQEVADNPNAGFRFQFGTVSSLVAVIFLTFSALVILLVRPGGLPRFREHRLRNHFSCSGVIKSAVDVVLRVVNWLYCSSWPKKVKESLVIAKPAEEVDRETILHHGDRRLNRDLGGSTDRRRRIAVR